MKRAMDVGLSLVALVVLSPLLVSVALFLLCSEGRPVLFVQQRVGLNGRMFGTYKFRTMIRDAEARLHEVASMNRISGPALQVNDDPRVTRVGRWLRKTSIDELPQLLNTLRGEMSIVGPRPAPMVEVERYSGWHYRRLSAKPGITGLAQVEIRQYDEFDERARLDIEYIDAWSLGLDIRIILKTFPQVLRGSGR
jgi:lipopolysaccharide/colanic/teichoic acid biosynthesis glycosyltransferase